MIAVTCGRIGSYNSFIGVCRVSTEQPLHIPLDEDHTSVEVRFYPDPPEGALIGILTGFATQPDESVIADFIDLYFPKSAEEASEILDGLDLGYENSDYDAGIGMYLYTASGRYLMAVCERGFREAPDFNRDNSPIEEDWPEDPLAALYDLLIS